MNGSFKKLFFFVGKITAFFGEKLVRRRLVAFADVKSLKRNVFLTRCLVLFNLFLVAVNKVVVTYVYKLGLVLAVIVNRGVISKENFVFLKFRVGNRDCRNKRARIRMKRIIKKLFCACNLYDVALINNADMVRNKADY